LEVRPSQVLGAVSSLSMLSFVSPSSPEDDKVIVSGMKKLCVYTRN
jgi:hypothetical protein